MNFVALDWLNKINPNIVGIVKTEYSRELREDTQLAELVPRIANNVDALLARHDIIGGVEKLWVEDNIAVDRVNRVKHGQQYPTKKKQSFYSNNKSLKKPFCPECHFLARKLKLHINFQHVPADCPRPRSAINLIFAGEEDLAIADNEPYTADYERLNLQPTSGDNHHQDQEDGELLLNTEGGDYNAFIVNEINYPDLYSTVLLLKQKYCSVRKEYSPQLRTKIGTVVADSIIDEGSELNCICSSIAAKCNIQYNPVKIKAMSAGSNEMKILGVVPDYIELTVCKPNKNHAEKCCCREEFGTKYPYRRAR